MATGDIDLGRDMLHRCAGNPILTLDDIPFRCNTVFNGAPLKVNGKYLLLLRIEGQQGYSFFAMARSDDGYKFTVDPEPCMCPATEGPWAVWEENGIEDPRVSQVDCKGRSKSVALGGAIV